jgi:parallel beta-helix repeat protein
MINTSDTRGDLVNALCGMVVSSSSGVTVTGNTVGNTQCGIALYSASNNTITKNQIFASRVNDGIYICGNGNVVQSNRISGSDDAAIHLDNTIAACSGLGNNNTVTLNTINEACAGVLLPPGTTGNSITPNTFNSVKTITSSGLCTF